MVWLPSPGFQFTIGHLAFNIVRRVIAARPRIDQLA